MAACSSSSAPTEAVEYAYKAVADGVQSADGQYLPKWKLFVAFCLERDRPDPSVVVDEESIADCIMILKFKREVDETKFQMGEVHLKAILNDSMTSHMKNSGLFPSSSDLLSSSTFLFTWSSQVE